MFGVGLALPSRRPTRRPPHRGPRRGRADRGGQPPSARASASRPAGGGPRPSCSDLSVSVASTVVLTRVLGDRNELHTPLGHTAVGWLVVQDVYAVFVLSLMPPLLDRRRGGRRANRGTGRARGGEDRCPRRGRARRRRTGHPVASAPRRRATHSRELFTLTVLVVAIGIAVGSYGFVRRVDGSGRVPRRNGGWAVRVQPPGGDGCASHARRLRRPVLRLGRDAVRPVRSCSARPASCWPPWLVVMIGTPLVACAVMLLLARPVSFRTRDWPGARRRSASSRSWWPALGRSLQVLPDEAIQAVVAAAIISISLNPLLYRTGRADRSLGGPAAAAGPPAGRPRPPRTLPGGRGRGGRRGACRPEPPRGRGRLRAGRANVVAPPPRERHRADDRRDEPGDGAAAPLRGSPCRLRRRHAPRDAEGGGRRPCRDAPVSPRPGSRGPARSSAARAS